MSDVALRCPHCGTTQATTGECEACHESDVRYYCRNHTPVRWLDGPMCDACGARFGVSRPARPVPPMSVPPGSVPPTPAREERRPTPRSPTARPTGPRIPGLPWPGFPRVPRAPRPPVDDPWSRPAEPAEADYEVGRPGGWAPPPIRINPAPVFGCVGRLVKLVIAMIILLFSLGMCFFYGAGGNFIVI